MFPGEDCTHMKRFPLKLQDGVPLMGPIVENWEPVASFEARPDDIVIATYPKAGTTWVQEMIDLIGTEGSLIKSQRAPTHLRSPFLEIWAREQTSSGVELLNKAESPRMIKTHLPVQLIPKSIWEQDCKVVYVARNAKDNLVSYYHFHRMCKTMIDPESWEKFLLRFMEGNVSWGSWYDHVKGFWNARHQRKILYLFFEDIKEDPRREVEKLLRFLGKELPADKIDIIVENTTFEAMKGNPMANYSSYLTELFDHTVSSFMRKGVVGDWKTHFTVAQNVMFEEDYRRKMGDSSLRFRTEI